MGTLRNHLLILAGLVILALPASASAGQYEVSACNYTLEGTNNSWVWESSDTSEHDPYAEHSNCPDRLGGSGGNTDREGGLSTTDALHLSNGAPTGTSAGWTFTAPTGTTIAGISYERYIGLNYDPYPNSWSPALRADGTIVADETCEDTPANSGECHIGGPPGHDSEPSTVTGLSAHRLILGIDCQAKAGEECITGASEYDVWAAMYGANVTIDDPTPPTLQTPTGNLWGPGEHNGYHAGTESLSTSAQDIGGGVQTIILAVDGHPTQTYNAQCDFTYPQPCPTTTGPQTFTLDTSQLSDGPHTFTLAAIDAAGNQSTIASHQITVANNPPDAPTMLTAIATQPDSTYIVTWKDPPSQPIPITSATYQLCPASTPATCSTPTQAPAEGPATITLPSAGTWMLAVWLTNAAGLANSNNARTTQIIAPIPASPATPLTPSMVNQIEPSTHLPPPPSPPSKTAHLYVSVHLQGWRLFVRLSGPSTGRVRITCTVQHRKRSIHIFQTVNLWHGRRTIQFKFRRKAIEHAAIILIYAQLGHSKITVHRMIFVDHLGHAGRLR